MKYKELFNKLEKKNPQKAYYLEIYRKQELGGMSAPYFISVFIFMIGILIAHIFPFVSLGMVTLGALSWICSMVFMFLINRRISKAFKEALK